MLSFQVLCFFYVPSKSEMFSFFPSFIYSYAVQQLCTFHVFMGNHDIFVMAVVILLLFVLVEDLQYFNHYFTMQHSIVKGKCTKTLYKGHIRKDGQFLCVYAGYFMPVRFACFKVVCVLSRKHCTIVATPYVSYAMYPHHQSMHLKA